MRTPRDRRYTNKLVLHTTIRTSHALPFVPREYMNALIWGILAKGQELFPVQVVAFVAMENHLHTILAGRGNVISGFYNYVHGELARGTKRIFPGLFPTTVWSSRPHEQVLTTPEDVLKKIAYLYANPCRAQQVNSIDDYNGVSTWHMFKKGSLVQEHPWIPIRFLSAQPRTLTRRGEKLLLSEWRELSPSNHSFVLQPYVWKKCFEESRSWSDESIYQAVVKRVGEEESNAIAQRKIPQIVSTSVEANDPRPNYRPKASTTTPFLQCHNKEQRLELIKEFRRFCDTLRQAIRNMRLGRPVGTLGLPRGGYLPGGLLTSTFLFSTAASP